MVFRVKIVNRYVIIYYGFGFYFLDSRNRNLGRILYFKMKDNLEMSFIKLEGYFRILLMV